MNLKFGLQFEDLYSLAGLAKLDRIFLDYLSKQDSILYESLVKYRTSSEINDKEYSEFLLALSPTFDDFLAELFNIETEVNKLRKQHQEFDIIYECKRKFVQRRAIKKYPENIAAEINFTEISKKLEELIGTLSERSFAERVLSWLDDEDNNLENLDLAAKYAAYLVYFGQRTCLFSFPQAIDQESLVNIEKIKIRTIRQGFDYIDPVKTQDNALDNSHYCIYCHKQGKDSCSKGLKNYQNQTIEKNGCPLDQKISEMNYVKAQGFNLAALAIIIVDNPIVAATGHRICNDCMKSCIFQKQEPVNIPLVETNILEDTLKLPFGAEIYLLLTRWNPLNISAPLPKPYSGKNVLIAGLGPAGIALSHYLLNDGHNIVAIDGIKITPLDKKLLEPIKNWKQLQQKLSARIPEGFGGVAEYGITVRWDKNNLLLLRLLLERRQSFKLFGGIRLGSNITLKQAFFELNIDHVAIAAGAGQPKLASFTNFLAKGVKPAADFLMTLQSTGAFLKDSIANLTLRMPIAVIGGGLTAVDAAVEALNYYPLQVEKFLSRYEVFSAKYGGGFVQKNWSEEDKKVANEFINHAKLFRQSKNILQTMQGLGGVTIYYRRSLKDSPAYRLNHEEIIHAIADGVKFAANMDPLAINVDEYGHCQEIIFRREESEVNILAKTVLLATGTEQNKFVDLNANEFEDKISYFGDADPKFAGSVVKAIASAKQGYKKISTKLATSFLETQENKAFFTKVKDSLESKVVAVNLLTDRVVELIIYSPLAAKNFRPGQFFKLQNFNNDPSKIIEPLALTGAYTNPEQGLISLIILEVGSSSNLCRQFRIGEQIMLMGPTGTPTEILQNKNVMLIGGGLGNAVLFSIGKALRENGCKVTYVAGYRKVRDRFYAEKIEEAADQVIWCCEEEEMPKNREKDCSFKGNILQWIENYADIADLNQMDRIICIGSDGLMKAVKNVKNSFFVRKTELICSINSPMQCMMKGICGQCVQKTYSKDEYIFTCICQDQNADNIDFNNLSLRLKQNSLLEKLSALD